MSIPPLVSRTPPPIPEIDDDEDDDEDEELYFHNNITPSESPEHIISNSKPIVHPFVNCNELVENVKSNESNILKLSINSNSVDHNHESPEDSLSKFSEENDISNLSNNTTDLPNTDNTTVAEDGSSVPIDVPPEPVDSSTSIFDNNFDEYNQWDTEIVDEVSSATNDLSQPEGNTEADPHQNLIESVDKFISEELGDDDFDDFDDFQCASTTEFSTQVEVPVDQLPDNDDEFDSELTDFISEPVAVPENLDECEPDPFITQATPSMSFSEVLSLQWDTKAYDPSETQSMSSSLNVSSNSITQDLFKLDTSHALKFTWTSSCSKTKLLSSLNIDSRNILIGRWTMSSLMDSTVHSTSTSQPTTTDQISSLVLNPDITNLNKTNIPEAHFDWDGSGLVNPFDITLDPITSPIPIDVLSSKSKEVLQTIPDLSFMKKTCIVSPYCICKYNDTNK